MFLTFVLIKIFFFCDPLFQHCESVMGFQLTVYMCWGWVSSVGTLARI
jgi:hypothetical protein